MQRTPLALALCCATLAHSPLASAAPYVAGNVALTSTKYGDVKNGTGISAVAGYEVNDLGRFPVFVEGSYYNSGKLDVEGLGLQLKYSGLQLFGGVALKFSQQSESRAWAKIGYYSLDGRLTDGFNSASEKTNGLSFGLGTDLMWSKRLGLRLEVEQPTKVKAIPGFSSNETTSLSIVKIGLVWRPQFGASSTAVAAPSAETTITPASTAPETPASKPAAAAMPTPPPPPAAPAQMVTPLRVGMAATLPTGAKLRGQPKGDGVLLATPSTDTQVTLTGENLNSSGTWWYVEGAGVQGWVSGSELVVR